VPDGVKATRDRGNRASAGHMSFTSLALVVAVVALVGYLLASLIFPERF
jgi:K+-transporting ATPase KdpF subunit